MWFGDTFLLKMDSKIILIALLDANLAIIRTTLLILMMGLKKAH